MKENNFYLSSEEYSLITDPGIFYTKHQVISKVYSLFGTLSSAYSLQTGSLPGEVVAISPKIYKGENYRQLPYVMLDHPRFFSSAEAFAVRSLFWWGKHFSIHLLLGGKYKTAYQGKILEAIRSAPFRDWHIALTDDPWQHHFEEDNYVPAYKFSDENRSGEYLKLGKLLPLDNWAESEKFFKNAFGQILSVTGPVAPSHPGQPEVR